LETTGGSAGQDRITEIAAVRIEHGLETARWSTLVNPGVPIPPFIQSLTGITDAMVEDAPAFEDVAQALMELLDGAVFVAHNVRFDHGFVLKEMERIGIALQVDTLCSVRLSRKLYPQHKGHGLDAIAQRHGLHNRARHRAMGDVDVVLDWLALATRELGADVVKTQASALVQGSARVPPQLETPLGDIPDSPGVYLLLGDGPLPLYIGKGMSLRTRVMSHFQAAAKVAREVRIQQETRRVEWRETAGELGATLLLARLVKQMQPILNRRVSRKRQQLELEQLQLPDWPHPGRVGLREHHAATERTDIHVFDHWCHVATVHDEAELEEAAHSRDHLAFDADTYRLLAARLAPPLGRDRAVFHLEAKRDDEH
jgi:DNA polymerase-3 subunit epsilon